MRITLVSGNQADLHDLPDHCPFCHSKISPRVATGHEGKSGLEVFMWCPSNECKHSFIAYYDWYGAYRERTTAGSIIGRSFSKSIESISPAFSVIYNEAYIAEQNDLFEICGVGYRKAIEFLVKDYSIANNPDDRDKIERKMLAQCIKDYVTNDRVKTVATRAVWLGNDETHYVRKWEGKNLEDLKKLIDLTVHWIEMEALTKSFEQDMPD